MSREKLLKQVESYEIIGCSFLSKNFDPLKIEKDAQLDFCAISKLKSIIRSDSDLDSSLMKKMQNIFTKLENIKYKISSFRCIFIISMLDSIYSNTNYRSFFELLLEFINKNISDPIYLQWYGSLEKEEFLKVVQNLQTFISLEIMQLKNNHKMVYDTANWLGILQKINKEKRIIHYKEFYNDAFNNDHNFLKVELKKWFLNKKHLIEGAMPSLLSFSWMLNPSTKVLFIRVKFLKLKIFFNRIKKFLILTK